MASTEQRRFLRYQGLIRPPTEARSLVIAATLGCSHGKCIFCGANYGRKLQVRPLAEVKADIDDAAASGMPIKRIFLADGDALVLRQSHLLEILAHIKEKLPQVERVGIYGSTKDILRKSPDDLRALREQGLGMVYQGLESGDDQVLEFIGKGSTAEEEIEAGRKTREAGILLSVTVMLGMAGVERWREHILATADALNRMAPSSIRVHTVMLSDQAPLKQLADEGKFQMPEPWQTVEELRLLISEIKLWDTPFLANMRTNYLPLWGLLANERETMLAQVDEALASHDLSHLRTEADRSVY